MYLKSLTISSEGRVIREILFRNGINLIVDDTINQVTGNDIGKTTTLKIIDFCLGAKPNGIYVDPETKKNEYTLIKNFLKEHKVLITLVLKEHLDMPDSYEIVIERNFLARKETIRRINGQNLTEDEFEAKLTELIFPQHKAAKPTFRQIISHNIRYEDETIIHTLRTLDKYTSDAEYEPLHLFLLGCDVKYGNTKQELLAKIQHEQTFKKRLEKNQTKSGYETALALIESDIEKLNKRKANLNMNENFESDLNKLNDLKYQLNRLSSEISKLNIRRDLIHETQQELEANISDIDTKQLQMIYEQASNQIIGIQKTFDDLVKYHNQMIGEKIRFITQELPTLENNIKIKNTDLKNLLAEEKKLTTLIAKSDSFEDLENLINELNEEFRKKGEYKGTIQQIEEVDEELNNLNKKLNKIDDELFSDDFEQIVKNQRNKFNQYFSSISSELYNEKYALSYDIVLNQKRQKLYKFSTFNVDRPNLSSGKKQGEISCFDIAYILFADAENMSCLHFVLNDKKELMHDNQLVKIAEVVNRSNIQFVASILKDKLPAELNKEEYFVVKLSQDDKLFRIE